MYDTCGKTSTFFDLSGKKYTTWVEKSIRFCCVLTSQGIIGRDIVAYKWAQFGVMLGYNPKLGSFVM